MGRCRFPLNAVDIRMAIAALHDIHKSFGPHHVFEGLTLALHPGEKVGMVGANGSGKTTLLRLIRGQIQPDIGRVAVRKGLRIGYLPQEPTFDVTQTVMEVMHERAGSLRALQARIHEAAARLEQATGAALKRAMAEYDRLCHAFETAGGYACEARIRATLAGLGFEPALWEQPVGTLSGGQLSRLGLACVLVEPVDLLLLDEPTNHLDLQATEWLQRFLAQYDGAAVIVSHDRYLLDCVTTKTVELADRRARVWKGNYSAYREAQQIERLRLEREHAKREAFVRHTQDFIARNRQQEGMRKTARGRATRLRKLLAREPDFLKAPTKDRRLRFGFQASTSRSDVVLRCEEVRMAFGSLVLFDGLSFDVLAGDRLCITGPNGTGKTTLLKLAMGLLEPTAGTIRRGPTLTVGYLDQQAATLEPGRTVLAEAASAAPELNEEQLRSRLGAFLFCGDDVFKTVEQLSGGQQSRLMLCKLVLAGPDVLVLDEPTNHLDIAGREALEQALDDYRGTIIAVSHDRYFLDRTADRLLVMGVDDDGRRAPGRTLFIGGPAPYRRFSERLSAASSVPGSSAASSSASKAPAGADGRGQPGARRTGKSQPQRAARKRTPEHLRKYNRFTVEQLEQQIEAMEKRIAEMQEQFGDAAIYQDPDRLAEHQRAFNACRAELNALWEAYEFRTG